jgi:hypothetical protein
VNRAPALSAVAPVFKGVDVGDVGSRGQAFEEGVITILLVGVEHGEFVGGVGFTAQQEGERHKDSRLYWGSGDEQCSQESMGVRGESRGFYGGLWVPLGERRDVGGVTAGQRERERRWHL